MGLNIAEKALLKSLEGLEKSGVLDMKPGGQEKLDELREKQKDDQSSIFDGLGIFSTAQASEIDPNNPPSMLPTGAMDRETPFGDKLQPQIPQADSLGFFSNREFGNIRAGQPELGIFGVPEVQDVPVNLEELAALEDDIIEQQLAAASRGEGETFFDRFRDVGGNVLDFIKGGGFIGRGITSLANTLGDTFRGSRFYNPRTASGNRLYAPGARAGDQFGLSFRRDANSFANMLNRLSQGKRIGENRLADIMNRRGLTGIDVGGMADSIREASQTGYGGYGSRSAAAEAAASGARDYTESPGAMKGDMEYDEE